MGTQKITVADKLNYPALDENWVMPEWLKKYEDSLSGNGEPVQKLIRDFAKHGKNWAFSNIILWSICNELHGQIVLLYRIHKKGQII